MSTAPLHVKARTSPYPGGGPARTPVPDDKVPWSTPFPGYQAPLYTAASVAAYPIWADQPIWQWRFSSPRFNEMDTSVFVDRRHYDGKGNVASYPIAQGPLPLNPMGRTGMQDRGLLGRYGPNHAADPIVTRWKRNAMGYYILGPDGEKIMEFVCIVRADNGQVALPGGMVDPGETYSVTIKREFGEEALNTLFLLPEDKQATAALLAKLFRDGRLIYKGYVDDPRNTDHAWMETSVVHVHDQDGEATCYLKLQGGDDATHAHWEDYVPGKTKLYASHAEFVQLAYKRAQAIDKEEIAKVEAD